jgi:peptide deformylase
MTVRAFVPYPDARLNQIADPVAEITPEIHAIWQDMTDTMYAMPGLGLAAPQIGIALRLAVVDCSDDRNQVVLLANPVIEDASKDLFEYTEASPNLPGASAKLKRAKRVTVSFLDQGGAQATRIFEDLWATSVQHQIDHLNGKLYFDNLSRTKRQMILSKVLKLRRKGD